MSPRYFWTEASVCPSPECDWSNEYWHGPIICPKCGAMIHRMGKMRMVWVEPTIVWWNPLTWFKDGTWKKDIKASECK